MAIQPMNDLVLILPGSAKEKLTPESKIYVPPSAQERPVEATVVAVGSGKTLESGTVRAPKVKVGDVIIFGKYSGAKILVEGVEHLLMREDEILAIVVPDKKKS